MRAGRVADTHLVTKLGGFLTMSGAVLYLFARLSEWRYQGGLASWSPSFFRVQRRFGVGLLVPGVAVLLIGAFA